MKKETGVLTRRQEALMNFLWEIDTPLTANEMAGKLKDEGWSAVTLFKTVQALDAEGYLMVTGIVSTGKTYARKMAPSMSKAQYYGSLLEKRNIKTEDIPEIVSFVRKSAGIYVAEDGENYTRVFQSGNGKLCCRRTT